MLVYFNFGPVGTQIAPNSDTQPYTKLTCDSSRKCAFEILHDLEKSWLCTGLSVFKRKEEMLVVTVLFGTTETTH